MDITNSSDLCLAPDNEHHNVMTQEVLSVSGLVLWASLLVHYP